MKSVAFNHFPRIVAESNRFWLFNPVLRKRYENRPEERIRLKWVEYLLLQTDWKRSRIGFESPVRLRQSDNTLRADLILYSDSMKPSVLIECKSDSVRLNHSAAEQAARYNSEVHATHLVLTNGIEDFWFKEENSEIRSSGNILEERTTQRDIIRDFEYWNHRGFCSKKSHPDMSSWLSKALHFFWNDESGSKRQYLDFQETVLPVPMNHYYNIFEVDSEKKLAISFIGHDQSDNYIIGILNSEGVNEGIVSVNLNKMEQEKKDPITIFKGGQSRTISYPPNFRISFCQFDPAQIEKLPQNLMNFFD